MGVCDTCNNNTRSGDRKYCVEGSSCHPDHTCKEDVCTTENQAETCGALEECGNLGQCEETPCTSENEDTICPDTNHCDTTNIVCAPCNDTDQICADGKRCQPGGFCLPDECANDSECEGLESYCVEGKCDDKPCDQEDEDSFESVCHKTGLCARFESSGR